MNVDGLQEVHQREESKVFPQDLLSPQGIEADGEGRPQHLVCYRGGVDNEKLDLEDRKEIKDLKSFTCLSTILASLACFTDRFHGAPAGIGNWNKPVSVIREVGVEALCYQLELGGR